MPTSEVTFTQHEAKHGSKNGKPWVLNIFKTADGFSASTLDVEVAVFALALIGKPALVSYTERIKDGYTNYSLTSVEAVNGSGAALSSTAGQVPAAPVTPAPTIQGDPKQQVITRSFAINAALEALNIAGGDREHAEQILTDAAELAAIPGAYAMLGLRKKAEVAPKAGESGHSPAASPEPTI